MANPEHVTIARQGADAIAQWRERNPGASLYLAEASLREAYLSGAQLSGADLSGARLDGSNLHGADLRRADLRRASLTWADLGGANLSGADLTRADLRRANLDEAHLGEAKSNGADLSGANLSGAHLAAADLGGADLAGADLRRAELNGANLNGADLSGANLGPANLNGADLGGAHLGGAHLGGANLHGAGLTGADLTGADLAGTDLSGATLAHTALVDCDLTRATGLSTVNHEAPSTIGVDTLIASFRGAGNRLTPELQTFFLGAGVPRELLAALPRIVGGVEYYSCFISYGQPDLDFAKRVRDDLAARGVSCWLYALDATPGERTWKEIGTVRREADRMVIICSAAALIRDGVLKEIEEQIDDDPDKMVLISRDNLWREPGFRVMRGGRDLAPFLRERNYADFSDESRYEESLQRLLKALRRKTE